MIFNRYDEKGRKEKNLERKMIISKLINMRPDVCVKVRMRMKTISTSIYIYFHVF